MSDGDSIQAGHITTAYTTTDVVAEQQREGLGGFGRKDFQGNVIFSVGPTNITSDGLQPDGALDGIQGAGNRGGSGLVGVGGYFVGDQSSGIGVLGFGGPPSPFSQVSSPAGVGVKGVAGGEADGVVGATNAQSKSGVFGFNSFSSFKPNEAGYGVFGRCDTVGGAGVAAESQFGVGSRSHSAKNDGVVGLSDAENRSGVFGFNTLQQGAAYGVFGRCDAGNGAGVEAESAHGVGVRGHSGSNDAIVGLSDANSRSGVYGFNSSPEGVAYGVFGRADSSGGAAVAGASENGYGGSFRGGQAPMRLQPSDSQGAPTTGDRLTGEFYVDSVGDLYFCKTGGTGTAAKWAKLA
ncbi:MAG TPA: hypothetical protein VIH81_08490 [Roseiarcus sp.]|jgi:hypothetical protein